jgi:hypothetical protein
VDHYGTERHPDDVRRRWLPRYLTDRERILGGLRVHRDPDVAAELVAVALGGRQAARRWLLDVVDALDRQQVA